MAEWAGWERSPSSMRVSRDRSRFAMDGGVLANTPTREALDAIDRRPARRPMRRIMVLVYPHAPTFDPDDENADPADDSGRAPTVTDSLSGLLGALTSQGSLTFVEEIEAHNREAARWRGGRLQVLSGFLFEDLYELVRRAWRHYQSTRIRGAARNLADRVPRPDGWPYLRVVETAANGQLTWLDPSGLPLPYVPRRSPREEPPTLGDDQALSPRWEWGTTVALGLADSAAEILREALGVAVRGQELSSLRQALARVSDARDQMLTVRDEFDHAWWHREELAGVLPDPGYWQLRLICYRRAMHLAIPEDADTMRTLAAALRRERDGAALDAAQQARLVEGLIDQTATARAGAGTAAAVWDVVTALQAAADTVLAIAGDETRGPLTRLGPWGGVLDPVQLDGEPDDARLRLLTRLLTLDAATWLLADAESPGTSQEITLAQLSLGIDHHFAKASLTPDDKVAGNELHRFGGFLKRSWRINDWIWGRLDSAQMLCRLVLDPQRLLRIHALTEHSAEQLVTQLVETSYAGAEVPTDTSFVRLRQDAVDELSGLFSGDRTATDRGYLPRLARLAAHPVQQQIIVSELAALAAAVRSDVRDGASARSHGQHFLDEYAGLLDQIELAGPDAWHRYGAAALAAFDVAGIGREPLEDEARSDALIQTTVTTAASLVTLADSDRLGVRAVKPVTRTLRGAALVPYWLVSGLISGSSAARSLALLGFAIGGIVLTLGLLGVLGGLSSAGSALGAGIVLGALGFAALRSGTLLHGVVLLAPLGPLVALAVQLRADAGADGDYSSLTTVAAVLALVAGLALLASLPNPLRSPLATLWAPRDLRRTAATVAAVVLAAGVLILLVVLSSREPWETGSWTWLLDHVPPWAGVVVSVAAAAVGVLTAWFRGRGMRRWSRRPDGSWQLETAVTAPAGVSAGWAATYGIAFLGLAWCAWLYLRTGHDAVTGGNSWQVATLVWWAGLGLVLCLAGPWWVTWRARQRLRDTVRQEVTIARTARTADQLRDDLERRSRLFGYLVSPPAGGSRFATTLAAAPSLNRRGRALNPTPAQESPAA